MFGESQWEAADEMRRLRAVRGAQQSVVYNH